MRKKNSSYTLAQASTASSSDHKLHSLVFPPSRIEEIIFHIILQCIIMCVEEKKEKKIFLSVFYPSTKILFLHLLP